jgi:VanZ family protein
MSFNKHYIKYALLFGWLLVIFLLSNEPATASSERSGAIVEVFKTLGTSLPNDVLTFITRKLAHIIAYFVLGILMFLVVRAYTPKVHKAILLSVLFVFLYAMTDEFHQTFVPGRSGEVRDVLIDTSAGAFGVLLMYYMSTLNAKRKGLKAGKKSQNTV